VNYKSFTEFYFDSLGPFGDVIVSMLATIAAQDLIKISENTKAALANKKAAGVKLGTPSKSQSQIEQIHRLKGAKCPIMPSVKRWKFQPVPWQNTSPNRGVNAT
jgi:DNA invertase Pin-like site-specific DNA recombinase